MKNNELLPCRKCGELDYDMWHGQGTQAELSCNNCGQEENIQVSDLFDESPKFSMETLSYSEHVVELAKKALIEEWNTRVNSNNKLVETLKDAIDDIDVHALDMGDFIWIPTVEYEQAMERVEAALSEDKG